MKTDPLEIADRYLDGTASPEDLRVLQDLLRTDPAFRRQFARYANIDAALGSAKVLKNPIETAEFSPSTHSAKGWFTWRPLAAAAAGLVIGLFSASVVFGYASPQLAALARRELLLLAEGFELAAQPGIRGVPKDLGEWGGDRARIVEAESGVVPREGKRMLRLCRSDFEGEESAVSASADQVRILDLREHAEAIASGQAMLGASAWFRVLPREGEKITAGIMLHAFASDPTSHHGAQWDLWLKQEHLASGTRQQEMALQGDWTRIQANLALPPTTRFVTVHVRATRKEPKPSAVPVEFAGAYVDEVRVSLRSKAILP